MVYACFCCCYYLTLTEQTYDQGHSSYDCSIYFRSKCAYRFILFILSFFFKTVVESNLASISNMFSTYIELLLLVYSIIMYVSMCLCIVICVHVWSGDDVYVGMSAYT